MKCDTARAFGVASVVTAFMLLTTWSAPASAQSMAHIGKWKLNTAKSTYDPPQSGPAPQSVVRTYEVFEGDGIRWTSVNVAADGKSTTATYSAHFDGKDYAMTGAPGGANGIALKRVDDHTFTSELKRDGKVVGTVRNQVSADGKTMTTTNTGTSAEGKPTNSVVVYDKQ